MPFAQTVGTHGSNQHPGFAVGDKDGAAGLSRHFTGFKGQNSSSNLNCKGF